MDGQELDHSRLDRTLRRGLAEVDIAEALQSVGDGDPGGVVVENTRIDVGRPADGRRVPEVVRDLLNGARA